MDRCIWVQIPFGGGLDPINRMRFVHDQIAVRVDVTSDPIRFEVFAVTNGFNAFGRNDSSGNGTGHLHEDRPLRRAGGEANERDKNEYGFHGEMAGWLAVVSASGTERTTTVWLVTGATSDKRVPPTVASFWSMVWVT